MIRTFLSCTSLRTQGCFLFVCLGAPTAEGIYPHARIIPEAKERSPRACPDSNQFSIAETRERPPRAGLDSNQFSIAEARERTPRAGLD